MARLLPPRVREAGPVRAWFWFFDYLLYDGEPEDRAWPEADLQGRSLVAPRP